MASFTDEISKFNPYIQQLPVEAMVKVGMQKQAQYDQGVQKIQSYVDNIAGMDVYNDGDKAYLQSKLNDLGGKLKTVAAGDFSNQQLVNSVGGMATSIVKDPNVQRAVNETAKFKKTIARIEKDQADGKAGRNNIDDFYRQAKPWMESTEAGSTLQANYSQYRDVNKTAIEAIKALHPALKSMDIPFEVKDGKINTAKIADAMKRNKVEGITEGQIQTALRAALTSEDYNQLAIDGRSKFADVSQDKLNFIINTDLANTKKDYANEIARLKEQLPIHIQDPNKTAELNNRIKDYEEQIGTPDKPGVLDLQAKDDLEQVRTNPNKVKESMYTQGYFKQWGNAFKWTSEDFSYNDNPFKKVQQWNENMTFKRLVESRTAKQGERKLDIEEKNSQIKQKLLDLKIEEAYGTPGVPVPEGNKTDNVLKSTERLNDHMTEVSNDILGKRQQLLNKGYTDAQVNNMVNDYATNGNKANIAATEIGTIQDILRQKQYFKDLQNLNDRTLAEANAEVMTNPAIKAQKQAEEDYINKTFDPNKQIVATSYNGARVTGSEKGIIDAIKNGRAKFSEDKAPLGYYKLTIDGQTVEIPKAGAGQNTQLRGLAQNLSTYYKKFEQSEHDIHAKIDQTYKEKLAPRVADLVPTITAIGFGKDHVVPAQIVNNLTAFISAADTKEIAADENYNTNTSNNLLSGEKLKDTRVLLRQTGTGYQVILKDQKDPKKPQVLNMTQDQAIRTFGAQYVNANKQESLRLVAGRGSNNVNGSPTDAPMQIQFGDFPSIHKFQLTAQLDEDSKYKGQFVPKVHLMKTDGTYQTFEIAGQNRAQRLGYDQGKQQLNTLTDDTLIKLLKELYPTYDFSQIYRK